MAPVQMISRLALAPLLALQMARGMLFPWIAVLVGCGIGAFAPAAFASHAVVPSFAVSPLPDTLDDEAAKAAVAILLRDLGFEPFDAGALKRARLLEPLAMVWINQALLRGKGRNWALAAVSPTT